MKAVQPEIKGARRNIFLESWSSRPPSLMFEFLQKHRDPEESASRGQTSG